MKLMVLVNSTGLTVTDGKNKPISVAESHPQFEKIFDLVKVDGTTIENVKKLLDVSELLTFEEDGILIKVENGEMIVEVNGEKRNNVPNGIKKRVLETLKAGSNISNFKLTMISKFLIRLFKNPSFKVVEQLYRFIEANDLPLTDEGHFLAYKKIDFDYKDLYSHTIDNSVGVTAEMTRNEVEDNPEKTCSQGLHVCSKEYLEHYGSTNEKVNRVVIVDVDPADVVSVPTDYNNAKMRVCKYKVVDELTDFNVSLSSWYVGKHKDGWLVEVMNRVKKLYTDFWKLDTKERFDFERINGKRQFITESIKKEFEKEVCIAFTDITENGLKIFDIVGEHIIYTPIALINLLSKYDSQALKE